VTGSVELVGPISPFEIVDDLEDVASVLVLALGEVDFFVSLDVVHQVVVDGLEGLVEDLKVVSSQLFGQFFDVLEVTVGVFAQSFGMVVVVPS
jgi:hypothetical protein